MKIILKDNRRYILRFDKGEEVISGLGNFFTQENITASAFFGIGSAAQIEIGFYNQHLKDYRKKPFYDDMEIVSLSGNGSVFEGKPSVHAHGSFSTTEFSVIAGHVFKLMVLATCEIFLIKLDGQIQRTPVAEWNLNLLD